MQRSDQEQKLAFELAQISGTNPEDWFFVYRARHALLATFRVLAQQRSGYVVTQLLTCCTAVNPILQAGLIPIYAEVSSRNAEIDPQKVPDVDDLCAVMLQHTYGIVDAVSDRGLAQEARKRRVPLIEDSAHCVARISRDENGTPLADISIHSFGIEKMLKTQFGGAVWINPQSNYVDLTRNLRRCLFDLPKASAHMDALVVSYSMTTRILAHLPKACSSNLRSILPKVGLYEPAVDLSERSGKVRHEPFRPSKLMYSRIIKGLEDLSTVEQMRREAVEVYRTGLVKQESVSLFAATLAAEPQPLLKFPVCVVDEQRADALAAYLSASGYYTVRWYHPILTPGALEPEVYGVGDYHSELPITANLSARTVCLPTEGGATAAHAVISLIMKFINNKTE